MGSKYERATRNRRGKPSGRIDVSEFIEKTRCEATGYPALIGIGLAVPVTSYPFLRIRRALLRFGYFVSRNPAGYPVPSWIGAKRSVTKRSRVTNARVSDSWVQPRSSRYYVSGLRALWLLCQTRPNWIHAGYRLPGPLLDSLERVCFATSRTNK
jgi:hypothetical protein